MNKRPGRLQSMRVPKSYMTEQLSLFRREKVRKWKCVTSQRDAKLQLCRKDKSRELRHNMMTIVENIM